MSYAMIARADDGGLGNQLTEIARHVPPARALIVHAASRERGATRPERFDHVPEVRVTDTVPTDADLAWVLDAPAVFAAETGYRSDWCTEAARRGVATVLQANPELWAGDEVPDRLVVPTHWEAHRLGDPPVLPLPVARDRLAPRGQDGPVRTWYHPLAPAMADRNGWRILRQALRRCRAPITVVVRDRHERTTRLGRATIIQRRPTADYWDSYPVEAEGLVLPRRYGGLCMPMQEAASLGWPIVSLDLEPQRRWLAPEALVPVTGGQDVPMRGGRFRVADGDVRALADLLDRLYEDADLAAVLRVRSLRWADSLDWTRWAPMYRAVLGGAGVVAT